MAFGPSASPTFRTILCGCGGMSQAWLNPIADIPAIELVGLVDLDADNARSRADQFGYPAAMVGTDLERMIAETGAQVVFDVTVPEAHHPVTMTALRAGYHVLGEKPMAVNVPQAAEMAQTARDQGLLYATLQNRRFNGAIHRLRKVLADGLIGKVHSVYADFFLGPHFGGFRDVMEHVLLLDMAIHTFDQARYLSSADGLNVFCREFNPHGSWFAHGASAHADFTMTEGVHFHYRGCWCAEGLGTGWGCEWRVIGTNGTLLWHGGDRFEAEVVDPDGEGKGPFRACKPIEVPEVPYPYESGGHDGIIRNFIACLQHGETPLTHGEDTIRSLAMVCAAVESAERGEVVAVARPSFS